MKKTVLGVVWKNLNSELFRKHPKLFCLYLSNQISLRYSFGLKMNGRIFSITSYSLFTSWVIKQQKSCILTILNTQRCTVHTLDSTWKLIHYIFWSFYIMKKKNMWKKWEKKHILAILRGCYKKKYPFFKCFGLFTLRWTIYIFIYCTP